MFGRAARTWSVKPRITRRQALGAGVVLATPLFGCRSQGAGDPHARSAPSGPMGLAPRPSASPADSAPPGEEPVAARPAPYGEEPVAVPTAPSGDTASCRVTADNIEGPYWRPDAPFRASLAEPGSAGVPLRLSGRVLSNDCATPIRDAVLDFWQADETGHYDNDGSMRLPPGKLLLRGKVKSASDGAFDLATIVPGRYLNGRTYRPAHLHVKLTAAGFAPLTTQLYFPDDPYNDRDPFIVRSLLMKISATRDGQLARYDFVLRRG